MTQRVHAAGRPRADARAGERGRGDLATRRLRLRAVIEPVVTAAGYDLEEVSVVRAGRRHVVRVTVDADAGVSLDAVADVSRLLSRTLDEAEASGGDLVAGEYQLEVSSPGVDRPLTAARHWRRNVGRLVKVTGKGPGVPPEEPPPPGLGPAGGQLTGRVVAADDEWVTFEVEGRSARWRQPDLGPGRVQVEFSRLDVDADGELAGYDEMSDDDEVEGEEP